MNTTPNQNIVRRLRATLSTAQQLYFCRVFVESESSMLVCHDMNLPVDFESAMLRALRV
jgi:hypothetical protein